MRRYIWMLLLCFSTTLQAQFSNYVFTYTEGIPYQPLVSPTVITSAGWDDFTYTVPLGFTFNFLDDTTSHIYFDLNFGTDMQFKPFQATTDSVNMITTFYDLIDRNTVLSNVNSWVGYKTEVAGSSNITKIEWNNVGLWADNTGLDSAHFQCWFLQADNSLEFHIGPSDREAFTMDAILNIYSGLTGPVFALIRNYNFMTPSGTVHYPTSLQPAASTSMPMISFVQSNSPGIDSFPKNNTRLRWGPAITVGHETLQLTPHINMYPTLIADFVNLEMDNNLTYHMTVLNNMGQVMISKAVYKKERIDCSQWRAGNYHIIMTNEKEKMVYQIQKQ